MTTQFTKQQAVELLGEVLMFNKDFQEVINSEPKRLIKFGEVGKVKSVDVWDGEIKLAVDVYGDYLSVNRQQFESHCTVLKPEIIAHQPGLTIQ